MVKLLSIRNADKIQSLFDVLFNKSENENSLDSLILEIGQQKYDVIVTLLEKGITCEQVAAISEIDVDKIKCILEYNMMSLSD